MYGFRTEKFQELIYHRYGSPREYLNSAIKHKSLDKAVNTIINQDDDDKCWSLYLAHTANAFAEGMSYEEFIKDLKGDAPKITKEKKPVNTKKQTNMAVKRAEKILAGFNPEGGGA